MEQQFKKLFLKELTPSLESAKEFLQRGGAQSFSEYKEQVGYLRGLEEALEKFDELYKKLTQER